MTDVVAVDQFAGAGGTSEGLAGACRELSLTPTLYALNHWKTALETHKLNHPWAEHILQDIRKLNPVDVVKGAKTNLLVSSPECTWHSNMFDTDPRLHGCLYWIAELIGVPKEFLA